MSDTGWAGRSGIEELDLEAQLRLFETLVRHAPVGIALLDTEARYRLVNEKLAELNDVPHEHHIGRTVAEVLPGLWPRLRPIYEQVLRTGEPVTDVAISGSAGSRSEDRHWTASYYPIPGATGSAVGIGVVVSETTERIRTGREIARLTEREREALASVRASEASLRALLAAIPDFIFHFDREGRHVGYHAERAEDLFVDPDSILGSYVGDLLPEDVARSYEDAITRVVEDGGMQVFEYALDYEDGDRRVFEARLAPKGADEVVAIVRDVTEVKVLEERLRQSQKMEAVGRLAGGIAHDFNNLLTVVNANADLLAGGAGKEDHHELVKEIRDAGRRASALTRKLLLFSRQDVVQRRVLDLNGIVEHAEALLRRLIGSDVILETELEPGLPPVEADPSQIDQVLVNLCVNARDAMPGGGRLSLTTERVLRTRDDRPHAEPRAYSVLTVRDSGDGMTEEVRGRVFEPFFTTKAPGAGTGLGLSVVFGVVEECGGWIEVDSSPGSGSTFRLYFPSASGSESPSRPSTGESLPRGVETVFLVEDDDAVRSVATRILEVCGYRVIAASDGEEALEMLDTLEGRDVDILVADAVMPNVSGRALANAVRERRPEIPVLIMSGHTDDEVLRRGMLDPTMAFLPKPFTPSTLATRVRELLDGDG